MAKFLVIIILILMSSSFVSAAKIGTLKDIFAPACITVYDSTLYISDQNRISVFSLNDLRFLRRFSQKGQGPGEFTAPPIIRSYQDGILAFSGMKIIWFSKDGEILKEKTISNLVIDVGKIENRYALKRTGFFGAQGSDSMIYIEILDEDFNPLNVLLKKDYSWERHGKKKVRLMVNPIFKFECCNDEIYVVDGDKGFNIEVFNKDGNGVNIIRKEYKKIKIDDDYKLRRMEEHRRLPQVKKRWHLLKKMFEYRFPEYFPAIKDFYVADSKIYVITYLEKEDKEQYLVLNDKGVLLKSTFLPKCQIALFAIKDNQFYYLHENPDTEEWEIHSLKIE